MSNKNTSGKQHPLFLSKLTCMIDDFSTEILSLVNAKSKGKLYTEFVKMFLTYIPIDYRSNKKIKSFGNFTDEAFEFFKNRKPNSRKIEITKTTFQDNPAITILIATDNRPFIIDSLSCLISRLGLQAVINLYPVMSCHRDKSGNLTKIVPHEKEENRESLVFIKALGSFDAKTIKSIKEEINKIIDLINQTYDSWDNLLKKVNNIACDIAENQNIYEKHDLPARETIDFLNWLQRNNFTFLGFADFDIKSKKIIHQEGSSDIWQDNIAEIENIIEFSANKLYQNKIEMLGKINKLSPVHRNSPIDYILIKKFDQNGKYISGSIIFGLYGIAVYYQSIRTIPILRNKMNYVLDKSGFPTNGYNIKKLKNIIESLPRETLIQIDETDLYCMCLHMLSSMRSHKFKFFLQQDWTNSFINIIIFLPSKNLTSEGHNQIIKYLAAKVAGDIVSDHIKVVAQDFAHLFVTIAIDDPEQLNLDIDEIEQDLINITTSWSEALLHKLCEEYGQYQGGLKHKELEQIFPIKYKNKFNTNEAIEDIRYLQEATAIDRSVFNLKQYNDSEFILKIYSPKERLALSDILPAIENMGFRAIEEQSFNIKESKEICDSWIYEFYLSSPVKINSSFNILKQNIESALDKINTGIFTSDSLNKLLLLSNLDWYKVKLIKALTRYLHQTDFTYDKDYVQATLIKHHQFSEKLVQFFDAKFNPETNDSKAAKKIESALTDYLENVESSSEDKVLGNMMLIIAAITRTNYYQINDAQEKDYFSFKFDSKKVPNLPLPKPYAEIFVYSNKFEGIHLRGGSVARGGIRWSDRGEDYRMEVLGLMKSQMTKNTVIVPVGSKGTFYINFPQDNMTRDEYIEQVVMCYKNFLRGLLDVTDNLADNKIVKPKNTIIYDEESPYLVVAADKGTATFSDFANEVSAEYNFWLGDAFASGGSVGYDHKKMGITAKGAWISAQTHFLDMGIDIQKEPFSVVGIGDMSGDVFGNGMLLSKQIKLIAAFNHEHIFIDPTPDPKTSYQERKRLFNKARSKWSDYNSKLISKGGGIFARSAKYIELSPQIQNWLGINCQKIVPDELIKAILKSEIDLIWNGGIGTYIKSSLENNIDIGDKANDNLRCNGNEIKAKVISEGGNLGLSQLGRIEYAFGGGRINTDFIDNSAGVDCSDHEVNIKIALNQAVLNGKTNLKERNKTLELMTDQVEDLVIADNYSQNQALTIAQLSKAITIDNYGQLIKELENASLLDREVEFLPDQSELDRRAAAEEKMSRAELAVLLSYSKMYVDIELSTSSISKDPFFKQDLLDYFPAMMQTKFKEEITNHPLRCEIIRTAITNKLVNQLGGSVISDIKKETGGMICDIARAHAIICKIFDLNNLWHQVHTTGKEVSTNIKVEMLTDIAKVMRRGISWFIRNSKHPINIDETITKYSKSIGQLTKIFNKLLVGETAQKLVDKAEYYKKNNVHEELANKIATLETLVSAFDIISVAKQTKTENEFVANIYFAVGDALNIDWLRKACENQVNGSYWNKLSIQSLKDDLYDKQKRLTTRIIQGSKEKPDLPLWLQQNQFAASIFAHFVREMKIQETVDLEILILANKKFEMFLRKLG